MNDLKLGDQIEFVFADAPEQSARATVSRFLSDQQEGLSPEAENYIACWLEVSPDWLDRTESETVLAQLPEVQAKVAA